jgi:multidrug transporter EmrE-like cation transporter
MQAHPTSSIAKKRTPISAKGANAMLTTLMPLLLATLLGVAGQLVLKYAMSQMGALQLSAGGVPILIWRMATSPYVIGGLLIYGLGTFFWLIFLSRVPLSYAYPFVSLGIVLGLLSAWGLFHEQVPPLRWVGMLVVCAGVLLVSRT